MSLWVAFYRKNNLQLLYLTLRSPRLKFDVKVSFVSDQNCTEHTLFLWSHTHIRRNWDCAVSGARLMSHGGHFLLSPSLPFFSPSHVIFSSPTLYLFPPFLLIVYHLLQPRHPFDSTPRPFSIPSPTIIVSPSLFLTHTYLPL